MNQQNLTSANRSRSRVGCARQVSAARTQLDRHGDQIPAHYKQVLAARLAWPDSPLSAIAHSNSA